MARFFEWKQKRPSKLQTTNIVKLNIEFYNAYFLVKTVFKVFFLIGAKIILKRWSNNNNWANPSFY